MYPSTGSALRLAGGPAAEKVLGFGDKRRLALTWRGWLSSVSSGFLNTRVDTPSSCFWSVVVLAVRLGWTRVTEGRRTRKPGVCGPEATGS